MTGRYNQLVDFITLQVRVNHFTVNLIWKGKVSYGQLWHWSEPTAITSKSPEVPPGSLPPYTGVLCSAVNRPNKVQSNLMMTKPAGPCGSWPFNSIWLYLAYIWRFESVSLRQSVVFSTALSWLEPGLSCSLSHVRGSGEGGRSEGKVGQLGKVRPTMWSRLEPMIPDLLPAPWGQGILFF